MASTTDAAGITSSIISTPVTTSHSLFVNSQVTDLVTNEMNFVETLIGIDEDADTTFMSQLFFDSNQGSFSSNFIGTFGATLSGGVLSLNFTNKESNNVRIRSNIVGFGAQMQLYQLLDLSIRSREKVRELKYLNLILMNKRSNHSIF